MNTLTPEDKAFLELKNRLGQDALARLKQRIGKPVERIAEGDGCVTCAIAEEVCLSLEERRGELCAYIKKRPTDNYTEDVRCYALWGAIAVVRSAHEKSCPNLPLDSHEGRWRGALPVHLTAPAGLQIAGNLEDAKLMMEWFLGNEWDYISEGYLKRSGVER